MTFGDFRLDTAARQLFRGEAEVRLSPKAFDLLSLLADNRTRAVSKAEIHDALWPNTFVTEANLASLIAELRRGLDDRPQAPRYIRTVHRFGYAFCAEVAVVPAGVSATAAQPTCWIVFNDEEIALRDGENIIGRDPLAAVRLDFPSVSRRHARIVVDAGNATIEDLGSKNGTFLRTERVTTPVVLVDLDDVRIGSVKITVRMMRDGALTQTINAE
ncbi:MAG TPA: winged helix-turn-helix domain-containing protein [Vicinamibacterales bacterium]|nr:winged helix-turn-helix domain-containing protein [Vicinamibacterales bacterium]